MPRLPAPKLLMSQGPFAAAPSASLRALLSGLLKDGGRPAAPLLEAKDEAVVLAVDEGLGPLLGSRVAAHRLVVSTRYRDALVWEHQVCAGANLVRRRAVEALGVTCQRRGIPLVLLKGMAMIHSVLQSGERSMVDADVLVPESRWDEVCELARQADYRQDISVSRSYTAAHDYVRSFTGSDGVVLEIHRFVCEKSLFNVDYEGPEGIFARTRQVGSGLFLPDPVDLFLTLVAHAAKHTFDLPLRSFFDGLVLSEASPLPWDRLRRRAREWNLGASLRVWQRILELLVEAPLWPRITSTDRSLVSLGDDGPAARGLVANLGRLVWSHTNHLSPWQRFVRLAWLTDSTPQWLGHVGSRAGFRFIDAAVSWGGRMRRARRGR